MTHRHEWEWYEFGEYSDWIFGWSCKHCDADFPVSEVAKHLNATEYLSAEDAENIASQALLLSDFPGKKEREALQSYAKTLRGE